MDIEHIIESERQQIKTYIAQELKSAVPFIDQVNDYGFSHSGKMIRPLLTVIAAKSCGYQNPEILYKLAAMIEYIHTATLLHDDVVDDSSLRRNQLTVNKKFSNPVAVLVGDFIYTRAFQMMLTADSLAIMQIMADVTNKISEGEILQLLNIRQPSLSLEQYLQIIDAKTANLFMAAVAVAGIIAGISTSQISFLKNFARNLGIIFQMVDDILDYTSRTDIIGKNIGDDLQEGKVTLPLIYAMQNADSEEKKILSGIIDNPINDLEHAITQVKKILDKYNIIAQCQDTINIYYQNGLKALNEFRLSLDHVKDCCYLSALEHLLISSWTRTS